MHLNTQRRQAKIFRWRCTFSGLPQSLFSTLDPPSQTAWRPGPAVRRWAGLASVSEHPGTRSLRHRSRGSSCRSADADWCLQSLCPWSGRCFPTWVRLPRRGDLWICRQYRKDRPAQRRLKPRKRSQREELFHFHLPSPLFPVPNRLARSSAAERTTRNRTGRWWFRIGIEFK